ncbi:MAG: DUF5685 family protein [Clostridiales bacterium]|jgi:hypothetical protein|nr:DUF5685 family protein [Clostridiales bacterium]
MFGYILPVQKELKDHEFALYSAFYCGICLDIKRRLGEKARLATGYDMTFFAILISDIVGQEVEFFNCKCISNPIFKKTVVCQNSLLDSIADISVLLAYHKTQDDEQDGEKLKSKVGQFLFKKAYLKAKVLSPQMDQLIVTSLKELDSVQRDSDASIDKLAHPFANLIKQFAVVLCGQKTGDNLERLCYNIGKFVYLIDALDDLNEDIKKGTFNPFLHCFGLNQQSKAHFLIENKLQVEYCLNITINRCIEAFNNLDFYQSYSVLKNIIHLGLRYKMQQVLNSKKKLTRSQIQKDMKRKKTKRS